MPGNAPAEDMVPEHLHDAVAGSIYEMSPAGLAIARALAGRIAKQGGALLAIDYGHENYDAGDTLQALNAHAYADVFSNPGANDLTAHVDFTALGRAGKMGGARIEGPVSQSYFLGTMGISARAAALGRHHPDRRTRSRSRTAALPTKRRWARCSGRWRWSARNGRRPQVSR